ncbi:MAG: hypothetical protein KAJ19_14945 [Gammaproteobacteria bacterium]|nr:hypothetical protein [Gammaproteobacteria bacterium]
MKTYLEIEEDLTLEDIENGVMPQFVRIAVESVAEARQKLPQYEPAFAGKNYKKRAHFCHHSSKGQCQIEDL